MFRLSKLPVVIVLSLTATLTVRGAESSNASLYVSTAGNDANPGTEKKPFLTLQHAAAEVNPDKPSMCEQAHTVSDLRSTHLGMQKGTSPFGANPGSVHMAQRICFPI
jgi:hypothetical protein